MSRTLYIVRTNRRTFQVWADTPMHVREACNFGARDGFKLHEDSTPRINWQQGELIESVEVGS